MFITIYVLHMIINKPFILASRSSSRYRLLKSAGLKFTTTHPVCEEDEIKKQLLKKKINKYIFPKILAKEKALSISLNNSKRLVVGSDTIIIFKDKIINKANSLEEAKKKLQKLSGNKHKIISGVSVCYKNKQIWSSQQVSTVKIKKLNNTLINNYLSKVGNGVLSSVGCYQAEKLGPQIIESIKGDFFNVLGFPLFPFLSYLSRL